MKIEYLSVLTLFLGITFLSILPIVLPTSLYVTPAKIISYADNFPNISAVTYNVTLKNNNAFTVNVTLIKSTSLTNYVTLPENQFQMTPGETKIVAVVISLEGSALTTGFVTVGFYPANQESIPVTYDIPIEIRGRGAGGTNRCSGTASSCGIWPNCQDLTKLNGCYYGMYRNYYCSQNDPKYSESCTDYCCQQFYGSQAKCVGNICTHPLPPPQPTYNITLNITNGLGGNKSAIITLYTPGTSLVITSTQTNGYVKINTNASTVDLKMDHDQSKFIVIMKGINLVGLNKTSEIIVDSISPNISNMNVRRAYKISASNLVFTGVTLKIKYSDLTIQNETALTIYRCGDFNMTTNVCNADWTKVNTVKDVVNDIASTDVTGFSAYALAEPIPQEQQQEEEQTGGSSSGTGGSTGSSTGGGIIYVPVSTPQENQTQVNETQNQTTTTTTNETQQQPEEQEEVQEESPPTGYATLPVSTQIIAIIIGVIVFGVILFKLYTKREIPFRPKIYRKISFSLPKKQKKRKYVSGETRLMV